MLLIAFVFGCTSEPLPPVVRSTPVEEVEMEGSEVEPEKLNHQPNVVSFVFEQDTYINSDTISVAYKTFDADGDATREELFWSVNGREVISEKGRVLRRKNLKKGDAIVATLLVKDGVLENQQSIQTIIGNAPPQWLRDPRALKQLDGYTVQAMDPDGDPLTYRLQGAPKGMTISNTGQISYKGSTTEPGGAYTIAVLAEDPQKSVVQWSFSIQLSSGSDVSK
jgi:hypothetical protein